MARLHNSSRIPGFSWRGFNLELTYAAALWSLISVPLCSTKTRFLCRLATTSRSALMAENLFLRKQLAMFQERNVRPHRAQDSTRWLLCCYSPITPLWEASDLSSVRIVG